MEIPKTITFNGVEYRLMGSGKYYLAQSTTNEGRKHSKGLHVAIWEFHNGKEVPKGYEIHHKDGNPLNNDISNLECVSRSEHFKEHLPKLMEYCNSEEAREHLDEIRPLAKGWHSSEAGIEWHKKHYEESLGLVQSKEYVCEQCGRRFEAKHKARFCSHNCEQKWRVAKQSTYEMRKCVICGKEFEAKIPYGNKKRGSKTCSRECRGKFKWQRQREGL